MIRPLRDKVLLFPLPKEKTTKSGLYLPSDKPEKSNLVKAIVLDVGPGISGEGNTNRNPANVTRGSIVAFNRYTAELFWIEDVEYVVVNSADIVVDITDSAETLPAGLLEAVLAVFDAHAKPPVEADADPSDTATA